MTSFRKALILGAVAGAAGLVGPQAAQAGGPPGIMMLLMASQQSTPPVDTSAVTFGALPAATITVAAPITITGRPPGQPPGRPPDSQPLPGHPANN